MGVIEGTKTTTTGKAWPLSSRIAWTNIVSVVERKAIIFGIVSRYHRQKRTRFRTVRRGNERKRKNEGATTKTGLNHLSTDGKTVKVLISVDAMATDVSSYAAGASFQDYVDWKQWRDEMDGLGFLNVRVGVNCVRV